MVSEREEPISGGDDSDAFPAASGDGASCGNGRIFDPTRLLALLTEVAEAYAARAREPEVVENTSGKEAIAIVKASVEVIHELTAPPPNPPPPVGRGLRAPPSPSRSAWMTGVSARETSTLPPETHPPSGLSLLEAAVAEVCQYDPETAHLEPWARLLIRMDSLTKKLEAALLKPQPPNPPSAGTPAPAGKPQTSNPKPQMRPAASSPSSGSAAFPGGGSQMENPKPDDNANDETDPNLPRAP